jgi:hypothetical protein
MYEHVRRTLLMRIPNAIASPEPENIDGERSYTIPEFCARYGISPFTYHKMKRMGHAPVELRVPGLSFVRITRRAAFAWENRMEELQKTEQRDA